MSVKRMVYATFRAAYVHRWAGAHNFLANPHRHMLHIKVYVPVKHDDRHIEFIRLKGVCEAAFESFLLPDHWLGEVQQIINPRKCNSILKRISGGEASCEEIATALCVYVMHSYNVQEATVNVSEDGENGAVVAFYEDAHGKE